MSAAVTGGILAPAVAAASLALSGAVAAMRANPPTVSSPLSVSRDATTRALTISCVNRSTRTVAASRSALAAMASSSRSLTTVDTFASVDLAAASSRSAPSATSRSA